MKEFRNPPDIHPPLAGYTHQIEIRGEQRLLILSGQLGVRTDGTLPEDPAEQLAVAFENLKRNLTAAGMQVEDLVKLTFYLAGEIEADRRREMTTNALGGHQPCMTLVYVAALASPVYKVELDAWASKAG